MLVTRRGGAPLPECERGYVVGGDADLEHGALGDALRAEEPAIRDAQPDLVIGR